MKREDQTHVHLEKLEETLWRDTTRFDRGHMNDLLAPDFFEIGMSGKTYRRTDALNVQARPINAVLPLENFTVQFLSADIALLTYISTDHLLNSARRAHRTSIWTRENGGRWLLRFHQGTPITS